LGPFQRETVVLGGLACRLFWKGPHDVGGNVKTSTLNIICQPGGNDSPFLAMSYGLTGRGSTAFTSLFVSAVRILRCRFCSQEPPIAQLSIPRLHNRYPFPAKGIALEIALPAQVSRNYTHLTRDDKGRRAAVAGCDERLIIPEMNGGSIGITNLNRCVRRSQSFHRLAVFKGFLFRLQTR
jgi:hypothetical protein